MSDMAPAAKAKRGEINGDMFDRFSLLHMGFGWACGKAGMGLPALFVIAVGWEMAERDLKRRHPTVFPHPSQDSGINMAGDVLVALIGWKIASARGPAA